MGKWKTLANHYKATYSVISNEGFYDCHILTYNDGTKTIVNNPSAPYYLFKQLKWQNDSYIDGISGATSTEDESSMFTITIKHFDTIEVVSRLTGVPSAETWVRLEN